MENRAKSGENYCKNAPTPSRTPLIMMHHVYILRCSDGTLYVGCTNDLLKRLGQHNNSKRGAHYTKIRRPVRLMYSERFQTLAEARKREAEIKRWPRERKLRLSRTSGLNSPLPPLDIP